MQPSYPRTTYIRKGWVVRQLIKCLVFTGLMGFIIEQVSLFTWFLMVFHLHSCLYTQYVFYFSVHKSNCEEFEASIEREFLECYRESIEIISANIICLALHVLLFFPSLVSIFDNLFCPCITFFVSSSWVPYCIYKDQLFHNILDNHGFLPYLVNHLFDGFIVVNAHVCWVFA